MTAKKKAVTKVAPATKQKPGRKPKPENMKHSARIQVLLTQDERAAVDRLRGHQDGSPWCADAIRQRIEREESE